MDTLPEQLKPCPFCGSATGPTLVAHGDWFTVACDILKGGCGTATVDVMDDSELPVRLWNKRPELPTPARIGYVLKSAEGEVQSFDWNEADAKRRRHGAPMTYGDCEIEPAYLLPGKSAMVP